MTEIIKENPIETALVKENITTKVIAELKENYLKLSINGIDDKEGYKTADDARKYCKSLRVKTEKTCKIGREESNRISKMWIEKEKEVVKEISEVETHLENIVAAIDAEKERIEKERIEAENKRIDDRIKSMAAYGWRLDYTEAKFLNDEEFSVKLSEAKTDFEAKEEVKRLALEAEAEEKRKQAELAENNRIEAAKLVKEKKEFEELQAKAKKEAEEKENELKKAAEKLKKERYQNRANQLMVLGLKYTGTSFIFGTISVAQNIVEQFEDANFQMKIEEVSVLVSKENLRLEKLRAEEIVAAQEAAAAKAKKEAEDKIKTEIIDNLHIERRDFLIKNELKEFFPIEWKDECFGEISASKWMELLTISENNKKAKEEKRLALLPDKEKLQIFNEFLKKIDYPQLSNFELKTLVESTKEAITQITVQIETELKN